ncbi:MAG: glycosyltransferase [Leptolyngbyaceae cyanobacterium CSU_1_3]|nr:glycosyltransferase [Leptolyngbyaceae cyanobacterium CSU_1_3]
MCDRLALLCSGNRVGGDTKVALNLLRGLAERNIPVDLVLVSGAELSLEDLPPLVRVVDLRVAAPPRASSALKILRPLSRYLRQEKPAVLIAHLSYTNVIPVLAKWLAFAGTRLILVEHLVASNSRRSLERRSWLVPWLMRSLYPLADAVVAVSQGLAHQLQADLNLKPGLLKVIYNPVVDAALHQKAQKPVDHPWLQPGQPPVFLGVGRLDPQKDFVTLIQAFSHLRQQRPARLVILGEGGLRGQLQTLIKELELEADVDLPGFEANPYQYMSRSRVFVLSSRWEALPTVLIEAMACGCQVVATDCPYGPDEILAGGEFGQLVPIADPIVLASAMQQALDAEVTPQIIQQRAADFGCDRAVSQYLSLVEQISSRPKATRSLCSRSTQILLQK